MTGRRLALLLCPLAAILLHLPTVGHGFVFDDHAVIGLNPLMHDVRDLPRLLVAPYWNTSRGDRNLYRPLTSASFAVDRLVARGARPAWFHLVNVLLHGAATWLVTRLAFAFIPGVAGPALAGALFAFHPAHVEAVAGIVGRAEILAALGAIGAVLLHQATLRAAGRRAALLAAGAWGACLAAVLAKESAFMVPFLCLCAERAMPPPGSGRARRVTLLAGYGAVLGAVLLARHAVLGSLGVGTPIPFVDNPAAAAGPVTGRLTGLATLPRYAGLLLWPARLSADHSYDQIPVVRTAGDPLALGGVLLVLLVLGGGWWLARRAPAAGFGLLWIGLSAALTVNVVVFIGTLFAERLMYLPSVGLFLLAGDAARRALASSRAWRRAAAAGTAALLVAGCAARTAVRLPEWRDDFSLFKSAAVASPRSARAHYNLGNAYLRGGAAADAERHYRTALDIYPGFDDARVNLGMALLRQGRIAPAIEALSAAAARAPRSADVAVNLGAAYRAAGDAARAEVELRRALDLDPRVAQAWNNLGALDLARGDVAGAVARLREAVRLDPRAAIFRVNLGDALIAAGRDAEGLKQFAEAARLDPAPAEVRRAQGEAALRRGDPSTAEREFRAAVEASEPSARAANFLGYLLASRGEHRAAAAEYARALRLDPGLADAHRSLGLLCARKLGDEVCAARHLEASLRLDPEQTGAAELRRLLAELADRGR